MQASSHSVFSGRLTEIRNAVSDHIEPYYHRNRIYICSFERETDRTDSNVIKPVPEQNMKKKQSDGAKQEIMNAVSPKLKKSDVSVFD
jgi:hypothetical protein